MRSIQTQDHFPLSSVKPLESLQRYREYCLDATRSALRRSSQSRQRCPAYASPLEPAGAVEGLDYGRCPLCESLFLGSVASAMDWAHLLKAVTRYRHSPETFHADIARSRHDNVFAPKVDWIQNTLRLQDLSQPRLMEVMTPPSDLSELLRESGLFADVVTRDEMELMGNAAGRQRSGGTHELVQAVVLLESLDRVSDPVALLRGVADRLDVGGLLFLTALVCSGFDVSVLGLRNLYLYPPDRTNCFSLRGLELVLSQANFTLLEVSTPGVLDLEIVQAHLRHVPSLPLSAFERRLLAADVETQNAFQSFLQQHGMSSFARIVGRKRP